jgi:hypothetical protein
MTEAKAPEYVDYFKVRANPSGFSISLLTEDPLPEKFKSSNVLYRDLRRVLTNYLKLDNGVIKVKRCTESSPPHTIFALAFNGNIVFDPLAVFRNPYLALTKDGVLNLASIPFREDYLRADHDHIKNRKAPWKKKKPLEKPLEPTSPTSETVTS